MKSKISYILNIYIKKYRIIEFTCIKILDIYLVQNVNLYNFIYYKNNVI